MRVCANLEHLITRQTRRRKQSRGFGRSKYNSVGYRNDNRFRSDTGLKNRTVAAWLYRTVAACIYRTVVAWLYRTAVVAWLYRIVVGWLYRTVGAWLYRTLGAWPYRTVVAWFYRIACSSMTQFWDCKIPPTALPCQGRHSGLWYVQ